MRHSSPIPRGAFRAFGLCSRTGAARICFSIFLNFSGGVTKRKSGRRPREAFFCFSACSIRIVLIAFLARSVCGRGKWCSEGTPAGPAFRAVVAGASGRSSPLPASESTPGRGNSRVRRALRGASCVRALRGELDDEQSWRNYSELVPGKTSPFARRSDGICVVFRDSSILPADRPRTGPCRAERVAMRFRGVR